MARPPKFDYDSDDFYNEILALAIQGLTDAEIADALEERFRVSLSPEVFCCMKNGNYKGWTQGQNKKRGERLSKALACGRRKINSVVRGAYLKAALGGKKLKNISTTTRRIRINGVLTNDEEIQTTTTEIEQPSNIQALSTWLHNQDPEWRKGERSEDDEEGTGKGIAVDKWIKDNEDD